MLKENNYDFLKRMKVIHKPSRRDFSLPVPAGSFALDHEWKIVIKNTADALVRRAASDFQDYLLVSMHVAVPVMEVEEVRRSAKAIVMTVVADYKGVCHAVPEKRGAFVFEGSAEEGILLC
ncbi:MAG: hypothetical protein J6S58_06875, partial [Lentisphaeria bacterium]|nr:hypothetical protein [Lentisphaeria bacterium]